MSVNFFTILFIYLVALGLFFFFFFFFWLHWVFFFFFFFFLLYGLFSSCGEQSYSLIAVRGLLVAATSFVLWSMACRAFRLQ